MTLARSGVIESVETTMSALLVCSIGMRVGPVVVTISSSTPISLASSRARSTSEPVGCILSSVMPKGGIARSMAIRILPAFLMSSSVSACAARPSDSRAKVAPAIRRSSEAVFMVRLLAQDDVGQAVAVILLVDRVQLAVLEIGGDPHVDLLQEARLVLLDADRELEGVEHELDLDLARRVLLVDRRDQELGGREDVDLAAQVGLRLGGVVLEAHQLHALGSFLGELGVVRRAAYPAHGLAAELSQAFDVHALWRGDHRAQHGVALREVDHLGALRRDRERRDHQVGLAGLQRRDACGAGRRHTLELQPQSLASALAVATSEPVGCILSSVMP